MAIVSVSGSDLLARDEALFELKEYFSALSVRKGRPLTYKIRTYGCQLNEADSEKLTGMLESVGLSECADNEVGDVVIFNTCAVRENAEDRLFGNLGIIKSDARADKDMIVGVCGCMMKVPENVEKIKKSFPYVDLVFDPQQIHMFPVFLRDSLRRKKQLVNISSEDYIVDDSLVPIVRKRKFRALVPIMYGCNNFCTYCIVPYARGRERSRDFYSIITELRNLEANGYKEVMLLGQNVNSYKGPNGETFVDILKEASKMTGFSRVRFMSSHPKDISDEVIDIMANSSNIETHLHLPLQSGSTDILTAMNRRYTKEKYLELALKIREEIPDIAITTDIIVGFPGETSKDVDETIDVIRKVKFDGAFTFIYSKRTGTPAAAMENQVDEEFVKKEFNRVLETVQEE